MTLCLPFTFASSLDNYLFFFLLALERRDSQDMDSRPPTFMFCTIAGEGRKEMVLARCLANELSISILNILSKMLKD